MKGVAVLSVLLATVSLAGCTASAGDGRAVGVGAIPLSARQALEDSMPGLRIDSVVIRQGGGRTRYRLSGRQDGRDVEIELTADGRVLAVEYPGEP